MRNIFIDLSNPAKDLYHTSIIREGEHNASQLVIKPSGDFEGCTIKLQFKLNEQAPFLTSSLLVVNGLVEFPIVNSLTSTNGLLDVEVHGYIGSELLVKSKVFSFNVLNAIEGSPIEIPSGGGTVPFDLIIEDENLYFIADGEFTGNPFELDESGNLYCTIV